MSPTVAHGSADTSSLLFFWMDAQSSPMVEISSSDTRTEERRSFLFLTVVMVPVLTGLLIACYGFAVWMYQLVAGPPTAG